MPPAGSRPASAPAPGSCAGCSAAGAFFKTNNCLVLFAL